MQYGNDEWVRQFTVLNILYIYCVYTVYFVLTCFILLHYGGGYPETIVFIVTLCTMTIKSILFYSILQIPTIAITVIALILLLPEEVSGSVIDYLLCW